MSDRPGWRLLAAIYPFGAGAAGVNLFFASLIASWAGTPVITPHQAAAGGLVLGLPASWAFARHITRLMRRAEQAARREATDDPGSASLS